MQFDMTARKAKNGWVITVNSYGASDEDSDDYNDETYVSTSVDNTVNLIRDLLVDADAKQRKTK